ncbi:MAG: FliM/FliN family flagellar motor switch protein [Hyphomicrobiales bacterium]|nr:FliM/FliN family flagellar motor switch protein [Hyphomicrobiales bacterium]
MSETLKPTAEPGAFREEIVRRIPVSLQIVLGSVALSVAELARLDMGAVLKLDRRIGEPVDLLVNGEPFGKGELVVLDGDAKNFAVSITTIHASN